jgi:predicted GIY-YIG superfamily endonuclease
VRRRSTHRDWKGVPVVYRYYDLRGRLLYVGCTQNMPQRHWSHSSGGTGAFWFPLVARTRMQVFPTVEAARAAEMVAIQEEEPAYNTFGTPRKPGSRDHWTFTDRRLYKEWLARPGNYAGWWKAQPQRKARAAS